MTTDESTTTTTGAKPVTHLTSASPERVWAVIENGWSYPSWVVGAPRMRAVSPAWPAPGSELHHSFGMWPAMIDDKTVSLACEPGRRLRMEAHGWPLGEAVVVIELTPRSGGTEIAIREDATAGPGQWLVPGPVRQVLIKARNREVLRRLALAAERSPA